MEFIPKTCPSCGGELMIPENLQNVICSHCGSKFLVDDDKNNPPSPSVENWMKLADNALSSGNSSEAMNYYNKILEVESDNFLAWFGKGTASVANFSVGSINFDEMYRAYNNALSNAPDDNKDVMLENILRVSNQILDEYSHHVSLYYAKNCRDESTVREYIDRQKYINDQIEIIFNLSPDNEINTQVIETGLGKTIEFLNGYDYVNYQKQLVTYKLKNYESGYWKEKYDTYMERMKKFDPSYEPYFKLNSSSSEEKCFIATATMGDYNHPYVISLRCFRDDFLLTNCFGEQLINIYYKLSPSIAKIIASSNTLRKICLFLLVKPLASITRKIKYQ